MNTNSVLALLSTDSLGFCFFFPPPAGVSAHNVKKNSNDTLRAFFGDGREGFLETSLRNRPQTLHINAAGVEN